MIEVVSDQVVGAAGILPNRMEYIADHPDFPVEFAALTLKNHV
jgi:hypothetical protein